MMKSALVGISFLASLAALGCGSEVPARQALALIVEGSELCAAGRNLGAGRSEDGGVDRLALGRSVLGIASELLASVPERRARPIVRVLVAERSGCRVSPGAERKTGGGADTLADLALRYELTASRRTALTQPFLERLTEAGFAARSTRKAPAVAKFEQPEPVKLGAVARPRAEASIQAVQEPPKETDKVSSSPSAAPAKIELGRSAGAYQRRLIAWQALFRKEGGAVRIARNRLEQRVRSSSMSAASNACIAFGRALTRTSPHLVSTAPNRELSLRLAQMLAQYRQGVAECRSGRPVAAYAAFSEGDREWALVARWASRSFSIRPLSGLSAASKGPVRRQR